MKRVLEQNESMDIKPVIEIDSYGRYNRVACELVSFYLFDKNGEQYFPKQKDKQFKTKAEKQQKTFCGITQLDKQGISNETSIENIINATDFFLSIDIDLQKESEIRGYKSIKKLLKDILESLKNNRTYIQIQKDKRKFYKLIEVAQDDSLNEIYKTARIDNLLDSILLDLKITKSAL